MTTLSVTPGPRPGDEVREDDERYVDLRPGDACSSDALEEADARRLAQTELDRATDEGMRPPAPAERGFRRSDDGQSDTVERSGQEARYRPDVRGRGE